MTAHPIQFLKAIAHDVVAILTGAASIVLLFTGIYVSPAHYKVAAFVCAGLSVLVSGYRVWADERRKLISLTDEHKGLQQTSNDLNITLKTESAANAHHLLRIDALEKEVARLSVKPFDEQLLAHTRHRLGQLVPLQRDLLRFLILRGGSSHTDVVEAASLTGSADIQHRISQLELLDFIHRTRGQDGYPVYAIDTGNIEVLKGLLFPRDEKGVTPFLTGL